jgi:hypothetical protein
VKFVHARSYLNATAHLHAIPKKLAEGTSEPVNKIFFITRIISFKRFFCFNLKKYIFVHPSKIFSYNWVFLLADLSRLTNTLVALSSNGVTDKKSS